MKAFRRVCSHLYSQKIIHPVYLTGFVFALAFLVRPGDCQSLEKMETGDSSRLNIVIDGSLGAPAAFGLEKMIDALKENGVLYEVKNSIEELSSSPAFLMGTLEGSDLIKNLARSHDLKLAEKKGSLSVKRIDTDGKDLLILSGSDDRGLMYALLEASNQIKFSSKGTGVFDAIEEISESPRVPVRSMVLFLHNKENEREWYYSREYWEEYFGMLAADRWNTFNLVFSHQTPYLAPMYPFHVMVDKYPGIRADGLSDSQREKNLEMLRFITSLAKDRGLDFTLSVWQQIAWGVGTHTRAQKSMVSGYNERNMTDYTYLALKKLLRECPGITGLQLRLNYESGITYEGQTAFFRDAVFRAAKESGRPIALEVRDIGLLFETLDAAIATGLSTRVSHKYWGEHMVFPYHPARFIWTYTYGDWLRYPRKADQIYQVWSLGSHRLLLWGDPGFVRRFAPTTTFEDAVGFELCAPLCQKGYGNDPGIWRIFRHRDREFFQWEFQRYWSFYGLFGRLTYNPETADDFWTRELKRRFGVEAAEHIAKAYRSASQVVSFVAAAAIDNYNMGAWPEKDMGGLINYYLTLLPYDKARFCGFQEHVENVLSGRSSGKMNPEDLADRLDAIAAETDSALDQARSLITGEHKEFWATDMDFRILSGMARYHARKIRAATMLGFFYRTGDIGRLREAIKHGEKGLLLWKRLSSRAEEIYSPNLVFGPGSVGHWKDNIVFVEDDLKQLKYQNELFQVVQNADYAFDFGPEPGTATTALWSTTYINDFTTERRFRGVFPGSRYDPETGYGWVDGRGLTAAEPPRPPRYTWSGARLEEAGLPQEALLGDFIIGGEESVFRVDLPEGHYQGAVFVTDLSHQPADHGPMEIFVVERFGDRPILDNTVIRVGQTIVKRFNINMTGERYIAFRLRFKADPGAHFIVNALTFTRVEPHIAHVPISRARTGRKLDITASVTLPPPPNDDHALTSLGIITSNASTLNIPTRIARATVKYSPDPGNTFFSLNMTPFEKPEYSAAVPAADVKAGKIRYYIEAEDSTGRVVRFPGDSREKPFFQIDVSDDTSPPAAEHTPMAEHTPGQPLEVKVKVTDESAVGKVLLYFRPTRQTMEFTVLMMDPIGEHYKATIPGPAVTRDFDLMYYFEVFDEHGNAALFPDPDKTQPYFVVRVSR